MSPPAQRSLTDIVQGEEYQPETDSPVSFPETLPDDLLKNPLPPINAREEIVPEDPECEVRTGDCLTIHVGEDSMEWYGELILNAYANKLVKLNLHNFTYSSGELDSWIDWYHRHVDGDQMENGKGRFYTDVAPIL